MPIIGCRCQASICAAPARIRAALAAKGLGEAAIETALAGLAEDDADPELAAAVIFARKRRLGPWRDAGEREALRTKDLAAMARAGFGYRVARAVVEAEDAAALEVGSAPGSGRGER